MGPGLGVPIGAAASPWASSRVAGAGSGVLVAGGVIDRLVRRWPGDRRGTHNLVGPDFP